MNRQQIRAATAKARKAETSNKKKLARVSKTGRVNKSDIDVRRISSALIKTLITEKPEEKQFWAEVAMRLLCEDAWVDSAKAHFKWADGVNPDEIVQPAQMDGGA